MFCLARRGLSMKTEMDSRRVVEEPQHLASFSWTIELSLLIRRGREEKRNDRTREQF